MCLGAKLSHAFKLCERLIWLQMLAVGRPTLAVSLQNGTKSDLRRSGSKNFPGGACPHVPHPLACALCVLYAISRVHTGIPLALLKILDPPLHCHVMATN